MGTHIYRWFNYSFERPHMPMLLHAWYERCLARPAFKYHIVMPIT